MKEKQITIAFFCATIFFFSCSNDSGTKDQQPVVSTDTKPEPVVEDTSHGAKKKEVVALGFKGKVESFTETVYKTTNGEKGSMSLKNVFKFNTAGDRLETQSYKSNGQLNSTTKYIYDDKNHITSEELYLANGSLDTRSLCKTDSAGRKIEQADITPSKTPYSKLTYKFKYDERGNITEWDCARTIGTVLWLYTYNYDEKDNRTEWISKNTNGVVLSRHVYRYDDNKNMIEEEEINPDGTTKAKYTYKYQFDKKNNWTRQTKLVDDKPIEIREREIKYF